MRVFLKATLIIFGLFSQDVLFGDELTNSEENPPPTTKKARLLLFHADAPKARPELFVYEELPKDISSAPLLISEVKDTASQEKISDKEAAEKQQPVDTKIEMKKDPTKNNKKKTKTKTPKPQDPHESTPQN